MADLIGTGAAAEVLGVTRVRVHQLISEGALPSQRVGHAHVLRLDDVTALAERRKRQANGDRRFRTPEE